MCLNPNFRWGQFSVLDHGLISQNNMKIDLKDLAFRKSKIVEHKKKVMTVERVPEPLIKFQQP